MHAFGHGRDAAGPGTHDHAEQGEQDRQGEAPGKRRVADSSAGSGHGILHLVDVFC
jgi:hypothetical protein